MRITALRSIFVVLVHRKLPPTLEAQAKHDYKQQQLLTNKAVARVILANGLLIPPVWLNAKLSDLPKLTACRSLPLPITILTSGVWQAFLSTANLHYRTAMQHYLR